MPRKKSKKNYQITVSFNKLLIAVIFFVGLFFSGIYYVNHRTYDVYNQTNVNVKHKNFINKIIPSAYRAQRKYNILASVSIAQAILESDWGTSGLSVKYNNLYGMKTSIHDSDAVNLSTQEYVNGQFITTTGRFKVYQSWDESVLAHAALLKNGTSWNPQQYQDVVNSDNYVEAAAGLQSDGYATDPSYTKKIIQIIEKYRLNQYDKLK
ncbi:glycoside hydrolase family 73 protein [Apilactobacillus ozensis]|uniref:Mannosyl-glycoprotein endo-beta-N-acetylglucosamidase n=1 Tax=Apilactobacillus ozensis DSM 23829 = JCM 17196 TaxID=1423781 RepID=A0A0R2AN74_9LACO|nr:glycoside hydrolase family 73 protein [Apilactobacillus ozensis]KRM68304.1 mannosyl-glycoprotein endo-beta-N-acetylglucosamidase [Apilactobacillus ozensis DSM 23829 = JCM 17196]MCK8607506.1 glycoside hydrolase family 73 protein [Apilactobacillus ozensis]